MPPIEALSAALSAFRFTPAGGPIFPLRSSPSNTMSKCFSHVCTSQLHAHLSYMQGVRRSYWTMNSCRGAHTAKPTEHSTQRVGSEHGMLWLPASIRCCLIYHSLILVIGIHNSCKQGQPQLCKSTPASWSEPLATSLSAGLLGDGLVC